MALSLVGGAPDLSDHSGRNKFLRQYRCRAHERSKLSRTYDLLVSNSMRLTISWRRRLR